MVFAVSTGTAALPTGLRPSRRLASTLRRMRSCSRRARQSCHFACAFCRMPNFPTAPIGPRGPLAHACVPLNEKLVVRKVAVIKSAIVTITAPHVLKPASSALASNLPSIPPAGIAPRTSGKGIRANKEGRETSNNAYPNTVAFCDSTGRLRNHFIPNQRIAIGNKNAGNPNT